MAAANQVGILGRERGVGLRACYLAPYYVRHKSSPVMTAGTEPGDGVLAQLAKALRNKSIPPADCPQCGMNDTATPVPGLPTRQSFGGGADYTFGVCYGCGEICGLIVTLVSLEGDLSTRAYGFPRPFISGVWPKQEKTLSAGDIVVPSHMPALAASLFRQARHNLVLGNWDAAGMTYRKTLEVALHAKFGIKCDTLALTIKQVSRSPPSVFKIFAWLTRVAGNEAAHEAQFSKAAALLLDSHLEQLVVYLFTVPEVKAHAARFVAVRGAAGGG